MLGWSINLFRIRGIQLAVHFSFVLLVAYVAFEGWRENGMLGMVINAGVIGAFFSCVVLHEFGHSIVAQHYGVNVRRILLMPIGGMAEFDSIPRRPRHELMITIAGPAVNFFIAAALYLALGRPEMISPFAERDAATVDGFLMLLLQMNLLMGCFNLVPVFPMDGGRILRALLAMKYRYLTATFWASAIGKVMAITGAIITLLPEEPVWLGTALFVFIFFVGELEYRAVKQRELDDARWRETLARLYAVQPPAVSAIQATPAEPPPIILR